MEEDKFDFWKAAEEAHSIVEQWPDWKRNIRLTEYSTGLDKFVSKKEETMTKFYNMKDCFDVCGDDDFPYEGTMFNTGFIRTKKDILNNNVDGFISVTCALSNKWQIRRATKRLFVNADEIAKMIEGRVAPTVVNGITSVRFTKRDIREAASIGIKSGRLKRDFELRSVVDTVRDFRTYGTEDTLEKMYLALENIPPLEKE